MKRIMKHIIVASALAMAVATAPISAYAHDHYDTYKFGKTYKFGEHEFGKFDKFHKFSKFGKFHKFSKFDKFHHFSKFEKFHKFSKFDKFHKFGKFGKFGKNGKYCNKAKPRGGSHQGLTAAEGYTTGAMFCSAIWLIAHGAYVGNTEHRQLTYREAYKDVAGCFLPIVGPLLVDQMLPKQYK